MLRFVVCLCAAAASSGLQCNASSFGALGDNVTDDTAAIQNALASAACTSVVLPAPGLFLSRALDLSQANASAIIIEPGAALVLWRDRATWGAGTALLWQSRADVPLVGFSISGGGEIQGGGYNWWPPENQTNKHTQFRPHTVLISSAANFSVTNITVTDSPGCNFQVNGEDLFFADITISAASSACAQFSVAPNTGGFRLSGRRILVRDSTVHNGDDCIPINPAPIDPANASAGWGTTENVLVHNVSCACGTNGPVVFSPGGTVRNVTFERVSVRNTFQGAGVKIASNHAPGNRPVGGLVTNITFSDITITDPLNAALYVSAETPPRNQEA